jgi:SAM-dependent methyltransferase
VSRYWLPRLLGACCSRRRRTALGACLSSWSSVAQDALLEAVSGRSGSRHARTTRGRSARPRLTQRGFSPAYGQAVLDWDHNAYYRRLLLRQLPQRCQRVLDVGCGAGTFAAQLAQRSKQVDAVDRCAAMIEEAKRRTPDNVNCLLADVLVDALPSKNYDAIFSITALHHMPLRDALPVLADALRPGGVFAAVALPRPDLRRELPVEIIAAVGHRLLGAVFLADRLLGSGDGYAKDPDRSSMPVVMDPPLTTREVANVAAALLLGVRVRRLLFWRYLLIWRKPIAHGT